MPRQPRAVEPERPTAHEYLRVSVDKSGREKSQTEQHADNERYRERYGYQLGRQYKDTGSASRYAKKARENFTKLLKDLESPELFRPGDILHIWESSRGSRQMTEWCQIIELCKARRVLIAVTYHGRPPYDPNNAHDEHALYQDANDTQFEVARLRDRVLRDPDAWKVGGKPHGKCPYGYERLYDEKTRKLVTQKPVYPAAAEVQKIFGAAAGAVSMRAISADLNERKVPTATGAKWSPQRVRDLLTTAAYVGKRTHRDSVTGEISSVDGMWEPIVDEKLFYTVQRILADPKRVTTKPGKAKHLLSMLATCEHCGEFLVVTYRGHRKRPAYMCRGKNCLYVDRDDLDEYVTEWLIAKVSSRKVWARIAAPVTDDQATRAAEAELAEAETELAELRRRAGKPASKGGISIATAAAIEPNLLETISTARAAIAQANTPPIAQAVFGTEHGDMANKWINAPLTAKREFVRNFVDIRVRRSPSIGHRVPIGERADVTLR